MDALTRPGKITTTEIGQSAERLAMQYLQSQGMTLITKNFACKYGEIDLIMKHGETVIFVEVRYRKKSLFGSGAETVDYRKQQKLLSCAEFFLQKHRHLAHHPARIDVVSIGRTSDHGTPHIDWIANAVHN